MNLAMEMLRNRAQQLYDLVAGESNIELLVDPVEEPTATVVMSLDEAKLEPNSEIKFGTTELQIRAEDLMRGANIQIDTRLAHMNWLFAWQSKETKVWIYNVSPQGYTLGNSMVKKLAVPACPEDEEYAVVSSLPAVFIYPKDNVDSNEVDYVLFDGRRVAMDLINPSNLGLDQDTKFNASSMFAVGNNYSERGVFFSTHNPPLKRELKAAHKRLKKYYIELMERANVIRLTAVAPSVGVTTHELVVAQQYVEDVVGNR